jgi:hypothetical protein
LANGAALSNAAAALRTSASAYQRPTICSPTGSPFGASRTKRVLDNRKDLVPQAIESAESVMQLTNGLRILQSRKKFSLRNDKLLRTLIYRELRGDHEVETLLADLRSRGLHRDPVWRLVFLPCADLRQDDETPDDIELNYTSEPEGSARRFIMGGRKI